MPLQQKTLTFPGKQFKLAYYLHKDAFLPLKRVPQKESTNITLKSLKQYIVLRCFLALCSSS